MKYHLRYAIAFLALIIIYMILCIYKLNTIEDPNKNELNYQLENLKARIAHLENKLETKEQNINYLKESLSKNLNYLNNIFISSNLSSKIEIFNLTLIDNSDDGTDLPNFNYFLPHLTASKSIKPRVKLSNKSRFADFVVGIPTIKREKTSYLLETIKSLLDAIKPNEKQDILIIIMIAELNDQEYIEKTINSISQLYKNEIEQGILDVIVPPNEYYPNLNDIQIKNNIYNDSFERVKWRTKQNYDFAYLMTYAWKRGVYYLQLEDDVISKQGFLDAIKAFIKKQKTNNWLVLDFTQLGFIGKLFQTKDLPQFISFFLMFAYDKPVDWLCDSLLNVKSCNPERDNYHCDRSKVDFRARFKPSLFQHVGVHSSLKGKIQKIKDKDFGKQMIFIKAHNNPPAILSTSLKTYMKFSLDSAYLGQNFFWSVNPNKNDFILISFHKPYHMTKYEF